MTKNRMCLMHECGVDDPSAHAGGFEPKIGALHDHDQGIY